MFQRIIEQNEFFDRIFPYPGATIRVTTAIDMDGIATVRGAYLRLGRSNKPSSATHIQSSSAIRLPIDLESSLLLDTGYLPSWKSITKHPDTKTVFGGMKIPSFIKACDELAALHQKFPFIQSIGWDISINKEGSMEIMEWNTKNNNITIHESINGPCFKDIVQLATGKDI